MAARGRLLDRGAVITGANQGIGAATARAFAREGARLHLWDLKDDGIRRLADDLRNEGAQVFVQQLDVSDPAQVEAATAAAEADLGRIQVLVNCAGIFHAAPLVDYRLEDWERVMRVNVTGTFLCCQAVVKRMIPHRYGKVVNLASIAGRRGNSLVSAYTASKHAVMGLTRSMSMEVARHNITVNAICPGYVNTDMFDGLLVEMGGHAGRTDPEEFRRTMLKNVPLGRMTEPEEVAATAVFLASAETDGMTGQGLMVTGGMLQA